MPIRVKQGELTAPPPEKIPQPPRKVGIDTNGTGVGTGIGSGSGSGSGTGGGSGSGEGTGSSAELQRKKYLAEQFVYIRDIIKKNLVYPPLAQRNGWTGKTIVFFKVQKNGHVKDIRIMKSSGYNILDESVIKTVRKVQPFPRPPISVDVVIPFSFEID